MTLVLLLRRKQRLDSLFLMARSPELLGHEVHQYLCRYICIRLIAYLDKSIRDVLSEFCTVRKSSPQISQAVDSYLSQNASNLNCTKIRQVLDSLDKDWAVSFEQAVTEEGSKFADSKIVSQIASLKGIRDKLAHDDEATINLKTLEECFETIEYTITNVQRIVLGK